MTNLETVTVLSVATNDNGTPTDTSDDFDELRYQDEGGTNNVVDISSLVTAQEPWFGVTSGKGAKSNTEDVYIDARVVIGQTDFFTSSSAQLSVNGTIETATSTYADYVFEDYFDGYSKLKEDYRFSSLDDVMTFIKTNKHLPGVTSIKELRKTDEGKFSFDISQLSVQLLEKIEELYLHTIEQQNALEEKDEKIKTLEARLLKIESVLNLDK